MKYTLLILSLFFALAAQADTLTIASVRASQAVPLSLPYLTDSLNQKGKAFDTGTLLKENLSLRHRASQASLELPEGSALLHGVQTTDSTTYYVRTLYFTLTTHAFAKARIEVKGLKEKKIYVGEKEYNNDELQLLPGSTPVTLVCLSRPLDRDTLHLSLQGKALEGVCINAEGKRPFTLADQMNGDFIHSAKLSPSGRYLLTYYYTQKADGAALYRTVITETQSEREVLRRNGFVKYSWMPRTDELYITRTGENGTDLIVQNPATGAERTFCKDIPSESFTLSPDASYFVYSRTQDTRQVEGGLKLLEAPDDRQPGWRSRNALYLFDFATGTSRQLTFGSTSAWVSDISRSGKQLLLSISRMSPARVPFDRTTLVELTPSTMRADTILVDTPYIAGAKYSPDGKQLLIKASPAAFGGVGSEVAQGQTPSMFDYRLYLYTRATRSVRALLPRFAPAVESYQWSAAAGRIIFSATDGAGVSLYTLRPAEGSTPVRAALPISYVQGYTVAAEAERLTAVAFGQTGQRARELFRFTLSDRSEVKAQRIGEVNYDRQAAELAIGACRDWSFRSSRGDSISGYYVLPPDFDATKRYPLIVYYYGGCTPTPKQVEFFYPLQTFASQGYVVYVCEPSGTIGYGQEFAARHVGTWGQGSADDIIEGTQQFVREHPYVDGKRIGCIGASYGGFMTQYLQTRTDLFACAISHAGISNIASYWGGGYWGYTYGQVAQFGQYPWNAPDLYVKQSPLFNADKIHTPLLLIHGTADTNVPTNESQQLFTALRILGRRVSYVQVDGENHVITTRGKRIAWQNTIYAWFARYLKGQPEWWETLYPGDEKDGDK